MDIRIVEDDVVFNETVERYIALKSQIKQLNTEVDECLKEFLDYSEIDLKSDFEGDVNLISGNKKVTLGYKFNRSINSRKLAEACKATGKPAQTYVKVKLEYPGVTMLREMEPEEIKVLESCTDIKRAKTSVNIEIN